jgi:hypothetical protein
MASTETHDLRRHASSACKEVRAANAWFNSKLGSRILDSRNHRNHRLRENLVDLV